MLFKCVLFVRVLSRVISHPVLCVPISFLFSFLLSQSDLDCFSRPFRQLHINNFKKIIIRIVI